MHAKDPYEAKYQYLTNKRESAGIIHFNDPKAIKNNQIKFSEVKNKQNEFLNKLSNVKIGKKNYNTKRSD